MDSRSDLYARAILSYYQSSSHLHHNGVCFSPRFGSVQWGSQNRVAFECPRHPWIPAGGCGQLTLQRRKHNDGYWPITYMLYCLQAWRCTRIRPSEFLKTTFNGNLCIICIECNSWVTEVKKFFFTITYKPLKIDLLWAMMLQIDDKCFYWSWQPALFQLIC